MSKTRMYSFQHAETGQMLVSEGTTESTALNNALRAEWEGQGIVTALDALKAQAGGARVVFMGAGELDGLEAAPEGPAGEPETSDDKIPQ